MEEGGGTGQSSCFAKTSDKFSTSVSSDKTTLDVARLACIHISIHKKPLYIKKPIRYIPFFPLQSSRTIV